MSLLRIKSILKCEPYRVWVLLTDDSERELDIDGVLKGSALAPLRDHCFFRQVFVEGGTLAWPNGIELCPDALLYPGESVWKRFGDRPDRGL